MAEHTDQKTNSTTMVEKFTNPLNTPIDNDINLFDLLDGRAQRDPEGSMVEYKDEEGRWHSFTAREFRQKVIDIAKGLIGWGITKGDAVSIIARTCWEWTALDMAIMAVGAITVPVYETNSAQQIRNIFNDSKVALAIAQDDTQRDKIESIKDEAPSLREVFMMEAGAVDAIIAFGTDVSDKEFWDRKNAVHGRCSGDHRIHVRLHGDAQGCGTQPWQFCVPVPVRKAVHAWCG